jgi:hypothetical protein
VALRVPVHGSGLSGFYKETFKRVVDLNVDGEVRVATVKHIIIRCQTSPVIRNFSASCSTRRIFQSSPLCRADMSAQMRIFPSRKPLAIVGIGAVEKNIHPKESY